MMIYDAAIVFSSIFDKPEILGLEGDPPRGCTSPLTKFVRRSSPPSLLVISTGGIFKQNKKLFASPSPSARGQSDAEPCVSDVVLSPHHHRCRSQQISLYLSGPGEHALDTQ